MKILYVGDNDIFARHELGFLASLASIGRVNVINVARAESAKTMLKIRSDNGVRELDFFSCHMLNEIDIENYDIVFATPRKPLVALLRYIVKRIKTPIALRLWSIRAAKLRDNLRFGAYEDILIFMPSLVANTIYIVLSNYVIAIDHATYNSAKRVYPIFSSKLYKMYPPYGYVVSGGNKVDKEVLMKLKEIEDQYVLGFTSLHKKGAYLKFEAKPHAIALYRISKRLKDTPIVLAGSTLNDWMRVFYGVKPPKNMYLIGRGFSDNILETLYSKAKLVIVPITNRNISNRLLEALFFGKAIVSSEIATLIHPELRHGEHLYISSWDRIVDDVATLVRRDSVLESLAEGASEAYRRFFSTKVNTLFIKLLLEGRLNE